MRIVVNILVKDIRFDVNEIECTLNCVKDFFNQCGHDIIFVWRLGFHRPLFGYVLNFAVPNGSQAKGRVAKVTYSDWIKYPNLRPHFVIHELNHSVFGCPDHYEGASVYEPCTEACIMKSPEDGTLCCNCLARVKDKNLNILPIVATIATFTAPIWFPILVDWFTGNK